jgi:hypothetical protein
MKPPLSFFSLFSMPMTELVNVWSVARRHLAVVMTKDNKTDYDKTKHNNKEVIAQYTKRSNARNSVYTSFMRNLTYEQDVDQDKANQIIEELYFARLVIKLVEITPNTGQ